MRRQIGAGYPSVQVQVVLGRPDTGASHSVWQRARLVARCLWGRVRDRGRRVRRCSRDRPAIAGAEYPCRHGRNPTRARITSLVSGPPDRGSGRHVAEAVKVLQAVHAHPELRVVHPYGGRLVAAAARHRRDRQRTSDGPGRLTRQQIHVPIHVLEPAYGAAIRTGGNKK